MGKRRGKFAGGQTPDSPLQVTWCLLYLLCMYMKQVLLFNEGAQQLHALCNLSVVQMIGQICWRSKLKCIATGEVLSVTLLCRYHSRIPTGNSVHVYAVHVLDWGPGTWDSSHGPYRPNTS